MTARETIDRLVSLGDLTASEAKELYWNSFMDPEWELSHLEESRRLLPLATSPRKEEGLVSIEELTLIPGDLRVEGDLDVNSHLVVLGDLLCSGYLFSGIHCCLIVTGKVEAAAINALRSYWLLGGPISSSMIWCSTYGSSLHQGEMKTRLYVEEMYFERDESSGPLAAETTVSSDYVIDDDEAIEILKSVLRPEAAIDDDGDIDAWQILRTASRGEPIFQSAK